MILETDDRGPTLTLTVPVVASTALQATLTGTPPWQSLHSQHETGLAASTTYTITVAAITADGTSLESSPVTVIMPTREFPVFVLTDH